MRSPYRDLGKGAANASESNFADGCVIASLVAAWSVFLVHLIRAAHREDLAMADAALGFVIFGVSLLLLGATRVGGEQP